MNFALCFLAYGDEHINEFNDVSNNILLHNPEVHIFVLTNDVSKIDNPSVTIIETQEEFNFNLKRYVVGEAFKQYDTIILLDTDIRINASFNFINQIETDGMYVKWVDPQLTHKGVRLNNQNNEYCIQLNKLNNNFLPIQFIPEFCVIIKITDIQKRMEFIERWGEIHNTIKEIEPTDRHYNLNGAIEGCIMFLSCLDNNIPIIANEGLFQSITHYASTQFVKHLV